MKDDLIKRSDAIKDLCDISNNSDMPNDWHRGMSVAISALYRVPSADRPQEEWIRTFDGNEWFWYCSNCKTQWYEDDLWMGGNEFPHYCPNCGCRMKGVDDEAD